MRPFSLPASKSRLSTTVLAGLMSLLMFPAISQASVVTSYTLGVTTQASIGGTTDSDAQPTAADSGTLNSQVTDGSASPPNNSQSNVNWNWDGTSLTGSGTMSAQRNINSGPPVGYNAQGGLTFDFTIDSNASYNIAGSFGFANIVDAGDSITIRLLDDMGASVFPDLVTISNGSTGFAESGILNAGSYTFEITGILDESLSSSSNALAGSWNLTQFNINASAIPEPSSTGLLLAISLCCVMNRRREEAAAP